MRTYQKQHFKKKKNNQQTQKKQQAYLHDNIDKF